MNGMEEKRGYGVHYGTKIYGRIDKERDLRMDDIALSLS